MKNNQNKSVVNVLPPDPHAATNDPDRVRIWRIHYRFLTELNGWQDAPAFALPCPANQLIERKAVIMAAAAHPSGIGIELTAVELQTPLNTQENLTCRLQITSVNLLMTN